jgi:hypothetical protein
MITPNKLSISAYNKLIARLLENYEGDHNTPYFDSKSPNKHVTIGRGFDIEPGNSVGRREVFKVIGLNSPEIRDVDNPTRDAALRVKEKKYVDRIVAVIAGPDTSDATLQKSLNKIMAERAADPDFQNFSFITSRKTFCLTNTEIETVFTAIIKDKEDIISRKIAPTDKLGLSRERAVLVEMAYQGLISERSTPLREAIVNNSNRAEAWFQIRYKGHMGKDDKPGQSSRHYREAEAFGLYNDPNNVSLDEAKQVYRMFQKHKDEIVAYEKLHGPGGSVTTKKWHRAGFEEANYGRKEVKTVAESFAPAKAVLLAAVKEQYKDNPTLVAKLTADINNFRPIDNYLTALKEVEKQPLKAQSEPEPVYAKKDHIQPSIEPVQPEGGLLSKIGEMGQRMHDSDVDAAKAQAQIPETLGILLDKMFSPRNSEASELSPAKTSYQQIPNPGKYDNVYQTVSARELRKIAFEGLAAIDERKNEMREWYSKNKGEPLAESMIEVAAGFSHLTDDEQKTFINNAVLAKERGDLNKETQQRNEIAEAYGYNRFYARIPNFLKNRRQKDYDQWGRELEQKDSDLSKREMENRPEMEKVLAKVNTPEFQEKKAQTFSEFKTSEAERLKDLAALDKEWDSFAGQKFCINRLIDKLPAKIGDMGIVVKGDPKDIDNLLSQSKQIGAQTEPVIQMARQYERGIERT